MKKLLMLLLALLCALPALAEPDEPEWLTDGAYEYYLTDEGAVLTACVLPAPLPEELVLPTEIGGQPIVRYEFVYADASSNAASGDSIRVIVPEGVTDFGDAFFSSSAVDEIVLPASLNRIREGALYLTQAEIVLHPDNPHFVCEDGFLIDTRTDTLLYAAPSALGKPLPQVRRLGDMCLDNWYAAGHLDLPDTLTSIGAYVFSDWVDVTGVDIPAGVTEIGTAAFNCCELTEVTLPAGLTAIEPLTFSCTYLTEIIIPDSVTRIGHWAFYLAPLTRVEIPASCTFVEYSAFDPEVELVLLGEKTHVETEEEYELRTWGEEAVEEPAPERCTEGMWEYTLTAEGAVITDWRYSDYEEPVPEVIEVPATLGGMPVIGVADNGLNPYNMPGKYRFTLIIPEGVQWLEDGALTCCHNADLLVLPASLTSIPEGLSTHAPGRTSLSPDNPRYVLQDGYLIDTQTDTLIYTCMDAAWDIPPVRRIGDGALENHGIGALDDDAWSQGIHIVIPEGVEELGGFNFYDCLIDSVTLPESLRVIETNAFEAVMIESSVVVPAGVELIEYGAFGLYGTDLKVIVMSPDTCIETADHYIRRTGEDPEQVYAYTVETEYTKGWE